MSLLIDGYGLSEIATVLGTTYSAAGTRVSRLRERIRNSLPSNDL